MQHSSTGSTEHLMQRLLLAAMLLLPVLPAAAQEAAPGWARTLERISTGVVAIQIDETRAFDT